MDDVRTRKKRKRIKQQQEVELKTWDADGMRDQPRALQVAPQYYVSHCRDDKLSTNEGAYSKTRTIRDDRACLPRIGHSSQMDYINAINVKNGRIAANTHYTTPAPYSAKKTDVAHQTYYGSLHEYISIA